MCELSSHHVSLTIGKISRKPGETPQQSVATESFCSWETPLNSHMKAERQAVALDKVTLTACSEADDGTKAENSLQTPHTTIPNTYLPQGSCVSVLLS